MKPIISTGAGAKSVKANPSILYDAKQPLLMWFFGLAQSLPLDPLWASRAVVVILGWFTLWGLYKIGGPFPAFLYLISPLFFFYNRQALMESPLAALSVWSFFFLAKLRRLPSYRTSIILGILLGLGFFTKSTALLFLIPALVFSPAPVYSLFILLFFLVINFPLFLQSQFWSTLNFASRYSLTLPELIHLPYKLWFQNIFTSIDISFWHLTPFILVFAILNFRKSPRLLKLWIIFPLFIFIVSARSINSRYLIPFLPLIFIPVAQFLSPRRLLLILSLLPCLLLIFLQIFSPPDYFRFLSRLTHYSYIEGYLTGDSTGYQVRETINFIKTLDPQKHIIIGLAVNAGNPEAAIITYFKKNPRITTVYMDGRFSPNLANYSCLQSSLPIYFVAREKQQVELDKFLQPVTTIKNPYNPDFHTIYTLKNPCTGPTFPLSFVKD